MTSERFLGLRVIRGPDWRGGDTDGGEGHVGTVIELLGNHRVRVLWDMGQESTCSAGHDGKCELRVLDSASSGVRHKGRSCVECGETDVSGTLWRCQKCTGCDLCPRCYGDDKHDLRHQFLRIETPGQEGKLVAKRKTSVKCRAIGIFQGSKVVRGEHWQGGDEDGGQGSEGEVKGYDDVSARNSVRVEWPNGVTGSYRLGYHGNVDLMCVEEELGPSYYRDHLPLLDVTEFCENERPQEKNSTKDAKTQGSINTESLQSTAENEKTTPAEVTETEELSFVEGDRVAIKVGSEKLKELQQTCGGCTARMIKCIGMTGEVTSVSDTSVVSVKFGRSSKVSYRLCPLALLKVAGSFAVGDTVRIQGDGELARLLNRQLGWHPEMDSTLNKVGRVVGVDAAGDVTVSVGGGQYRYSPACLLHAPHASLDASLSNDITTASKLQSSNFSSGGERTLKLRSANGGDKEEEHNLKLFQRMRDMVLHDVSKDSGEGQIGTEALYGAIHVGDTGTVRRMCQRNRSMLEREQKGLTPLIYACLRGQRACVLTLIDLGADVNRTGSGNVINKTPISAAIEGKDVTLIEVLLERGAHVHHDYGLGQTALHVAVLRDQDFAIRALARYGANVNAKNELLDTPLHVAIIKDRNRAMEALLSLPEVDMYIPTKKGFNAIHLACFWGNYVALRQLLARDSSAVDVGVEESLSTAVHIAAVNDHFDCLRLLVIEAGANVNSRDTCLTAALHTASQQANLPMVETLLELGADVNVKDEDGDTPLHFAVGGSIEGYSKEADCDVSVACRVEVCKMLIRAGAWVDSENKKGHNPFSYGHGQVRAGVKTFMRNNMDVVRLKNPSGVQPLAGSDQGRGQLRQALKGVGLPCGLCGAPTSDVTLLPCQHKCVCSTCSVKVTQCPLCDDEVKDKIHTGADQEPLDLDKARKMFLMQQ